MEGKRARHWRRLIEIIRTLGKDASNGEISRQAALENLPDSHTHISRAFKEAFPGVDRRVSGVRNGTERVYGPPTPIQFLFPNKVIRTADQQARRKRKRLRKQKEDTLLAARVLISTIDSRPAWSTAEAVLELDRAIANLRRQVKRLEILQKCL